MQRAYAWRVAELPRGTVTFLFTDIEGSTRLLKQLGERYSDVLAGHRRILRDAVNAREGREIDTQGDSFFFAFARANAALGAAVAAQRALAEHDWAEGAQVRVRMGLHTGEPTVGDETYVGLGVHRAARIGAAAHGGQVLLSSATRELVEDEVGGVSVRALGSYRLKDIDRPEPLFQLDIEGLPTDFPPLNAEKIVEPRPLRRRAILLSALAAIAAAVAIPIFAFGQGGDSTPLESAAGNSVAFVDPQSNRIVADVPVGTAPTALTDGSGAVWVTNTSDDNVDRIDPASHTIRQTVQVGNGPSGIAFGGGSIWVSNGLFGTVSRIDSKTSRLVATITVGNRPAGIVYAAGSVWVANTGDGTITRIDVATDKPSKTVRIAATELAFGAGSVWASDRSANRVTRIDPTSAGSIGTITVGNGPTGLAFGSGAAWVANSLDGTVSRINPETNSVVTAITVGNGPTAVAVDPSGVWVSNQFDGTLVRIDPRTNLVARRITLGNEPQGIAISNGKVVVSVGQSSAGHRGGTLTVLNPAIINSIDPAVAGTTTAVQLLRMTNDGLVAFNEASGLAGAQLVPDLAVSLPTPTDGNTTYTFRLRPGIRYSTGRPVRASDVRATFERYFEVSDFPSAYYDHIVGAGRCKKRSKHCDLASGIVVNDAARTVTFHLTAADPDFLYALALPSAYVLPAGTRPHDTRPLPATGPYVIAGYRPEQVLRFIRNRYFHEWSRAAQPDGYPEKIVFQFAKTPDEAVNAIIRGRADAFGSIGGVPSRSLLTAIETRFPSQVHWTSFERIYAFFLNTRVAPFDRLDVRRALNYAADRAAAVRLAGGPDVAQVSCQILPPNFPGYRPYCPYSAGTTADGGWKTSDLTKARALIAASGTRGMKVTFWSGPLAKGYDIYAVKLLRSLGYRATIKVLDPTKYTSFAGAQIGFLGWTSDYPAPSGFFVPLLTCASYLPGSPDNVNLAGFCDPRIDQAIKQARIQQTTNPEAAGRLWQRIDRHTVDEAPWVALSSPKLLNVLSKRVGNFQFSPMWTMLLDQLWVR